MMPLTSQKISCMHRCRGGEAVCSGPLLCNHLAPQPNIRSIHHGRRTSGLHACFVNGSPLSIFMAFVCQSLRGTSVFVRHGSVLGSAVPTGGQRLRRVQTNGALNIRDLTTTPMSCVVYERSAYHGFVALAGMRLLSVTETKSTNRAADIARTPCLSHWSLGSVRTTAAASGYSSTHTNWSMTCQVIISVHASSCMMAKCDEQIALLLSLKDSLESVRR